MDTADTPRMSAYEYALDVWYMLAHTCAHTHKAKTPQASYNIRILLYKSLIIYVYTYCIQKD